MAKNKRGVVPGKNPGVLQQEKDTKRMYPMARVFLYGAVVFVALAQVLEYGLKLITHSMGNLLCLVGVALLGAFFVVQARSGRKGGPRL